MAAFRRDQEFSNLGQAERIIKHIAQTLGYGGIYRLPKSVPHFLQASRLGGGEASETFVCNTAKCGFVMQIKQVKRDGVSRWCIEKMNDQHAEHCRQAEREGSVESLPSRISSASPEQSSAPLENLALPADSGPASDTMNGISPFANYPTPSSLRQNSRSGSLPPSNADYTGDASAQRYGSPHASHKSRTPDPTLLSSYIDDFVVSMNDTGEYESEAVLASIEAEGELEGGSSYAEMEAFAQKPFEEPQGWTLNAAARTFFPFLGGNKPSDEQEDEHEETVPQSINPSDIMAPTPPLSRRAESPSRRTTEQEEVSSQQTTVAPNLLSPVRPAYDAESESTDHSQGLPSTSALPYETNGHDAAQISSHGTTASSDSFDLYKIFPSYREAEDSIFNAFDADKLPLKVKWRPSELSPGLRDASYECMYECGYTVNLMDDQKGQWRVTGVEGAHRPSCYEGGRSKNANKRTTGRKKSRPWGAPARRRTRPKKQPDGGPRPLSPISSRPRKRKGEDDSSTDSEDAVKVVSYSAEHCRTIRSRRASPSSSEDEERSWGVPYSYQDSLPSPRRSQTHGQNSASNGLENDDVPFISPKQKQKKESSAAASRRKSTRPTHQSSPIDLTSVSPPPSSAQIPYSQISQWSQPSHIVQDGVPPFMSKPSPYLRSNPRPDARPKRKISQLDLGAPSPASTQSTRMTRQRFHEYRADASTSSFVNGYGAFGSPVKAARFSSAVTYYALPPTSLPSAPKPFSTPRRPVTTSSTLTAAGFSKAQIDFLKRGGFKNLAILSAEGLYVSEGLEVLEYFVEELADLLDGADEDGLKRDVQKWSEWDIKCAVKQLIMDVRVRASLVWEANVEMEDVSSEEDDESDGMQAAHGTLEQEQEPSDSEEYEEYIDRYKSFRSEDEEVATQLLSGHIELTLNPSLSDDEDLGVSDI